ncbi:MAG: formylglycine-generating enzyme family protein, partial [Gemmataceae bacterium]|nr:formylglycine-generating enzyme family protein [Gemmataceae bacterium]
MLTTLRSCSIVLSFLVPVAPALGGLPPAPGGVETFASGGIDYARVRAASVTPFDPAGHGNVLRPIGGGSWDFAISRTEVSQKVWVEFMGEFNAVPVPTGQPWTSRMESMLRGEFWVGPGMYATGVGPLGRLINRVTDEGATLPARFMGWYGAAAFCNWLHNDRQVSIEALTTGAYDLRQWNGADPDSWPGVTRQAGARYWIPSYDEWAVAAFYDPNRSGPNQPGWWPYLNRLERPPVPGAPGVGETSAGWEPEDPNFSVFLL